jgi:hypothetical protein
VTIIGEETNKTDFFRFLTNTRIFSLVQIMPIGHLNQTAYCSMVTGDKAAGA